MRQYTKDNTGIIISMLLMTNAYIALVAENKTLTIIFMGTSVIVLILSEIYNNKLFKLTKKITATENEIEEIKDKILLEINNNLLELTKLLIKNDDDDTTKN